MSKLSKLMWLDSARVNSQLLKPSSDLGERCTESLIEPEIQLSLNYLTHRKGGCKVWRETQSDAWRSCEGTKFDEGNCWKIEHQINLDGRLCRQWWRACQLAETIAKLYWFTTPSAPCGSICFSLKALVPSNCCCGVKSKHPVVATRTKPRRERRE